MPLNNDYLQQIANGLGQGGTSGTRVLNNEYLRRIAEGIGGIVDPSSGKVDASKIEGVIPAANLPSYVDDVIEGYLYEGAFYTDTNHEYEIEPESGKIYVDVSDDTSYRWTGTAYVSMGAPYELPTMSASTKGGAKLGDGLALTDGALGIDPEPQESTGEVRGAVASLTAKGHAEQDGTPTPSNPVPIQVARGKNLLPNTATSQTVNGVTFTVNADGSVTVNGTATANATLKLCDASTFHTQPAGTYTMSGGFEGCLVTMQYADSTSSDAEQTGFLMASTSPSSVTVQNGFRIASAYLLVLNGTTVNEVAHPQLELGSTPTPYVPYGHVGIDITHDGTTTTVPVPLPSKGYAASLPDGTADVLTIDGAGKVEWASVTGMVTFDGSNDETWTLQNSGKRVRLIDNSIYGPPNTTTTANALSSHFVAITPGLTWTGNIGFSLDPSTNELRGFLFADGSSMTVAGWIAWLAQNPVTVIYPLVTPVTEQCGYIDWPEIPDGTIITCPELDALGVRYLIGNGVAEMARQWYERGHVEAQSNATALGELAQSVLDVDGKADAVAAQLVAEDVFNGINLDATDVPNANIVISGSMLRVLDVVYLSLQFYTIDEDITVNVNGVTVFTFGGRAMPAGQYTTDYVFASLQTNIPGVSAYVMRSGEVRLAGDGYVIEAGTSFADSGITITGTYPLIPSGN